MQLSKFKVGVALAAGLLGMLLVWLYAEQLDDDSEALVANQVEVVKAARDIEAGSPLTKDRITTEKVPRKFLPPNPLLESELNIYLGSPLAVTVEEGGLVLTSDFNTGSGGARDYAKLASPLVIKTADLALESDSPAKAGRGALAAVAKAGGYIVESDIFVSRHDEHFSMIARVPADKFEAFVFELDEIGAPISRRIRGAGVQSDVEQLEARIGNKSFQVEGLRHAKAGERTTKRKESIEIIRGSDVETHKVETVEEKTATDVKADLANVEHELRELKGDLRELHEQTALSTVELRIQKTRPVVVPEAEADQPFGEQLSEEFAESTRVVISTFFGTVRGIVAAIPYLLALTPFFVGLALWFRRRRVRTVESA